MIPGQARRPGGAVTLNGEALAQGDGVAASRERALTVTGTERAEVLVLDRP